jgi:hypothetical protein
MNGNPKSSELIVIPEYVNISAMYKLRKVLLNPPYTASPAARHVNVALRFSEEVAVVACGRPASVAENSANASSPLPRPSLFEHVVAGAAVRQVDAVGEGVSERALETDQLVACNPQNPQTVCSTQTSSTVSESTFELAHTLPGRRCAGCSCEEREVRERRSICR